MSTDQTPALDRAYGAADRAMTTVTPPPGVDLSAWLNERGSVRALTHGAAHAAVSAALHDPDDPDWLARVIYDAHGFHSADTWDTDHDGVRNHYRGHADAVRAAILGEVA